MPLPQLRRRRRPLHALLPWVAALIPLLLGLPFLYWQASQTLKRQAQDNVDEALIKIEQIFDYAHTATESVASWVGARCEDAVLPLRQRSMATPYVRSLNLVQNGTIYCTSLRGDTHEQEQVTTYTGGTLRLMIGNRVTPARAVLILRHATPAGSVLAGIDSQYLSNALQLASQPVPLTLRIGETRLSANGTTSRARPRDTSSPLAVETSSHYPFSITAALPANGALLRFTGGQIALVLELTERELLVQSEHTDHLFEQLHQLGVHIALDDFGTGNASLAYLRQFRVDYLKIDRSFVQMTDDDALSQHLLDTILTLSSRLGLDSVAEGVETMAQRDYLIRHGVRYLQGFLYARPMPLANLLETLAHPPAADIVEHAAH